MKRHTNVTYMQKEGTMNDSFDLFSGLFVHNRFAQQEVWTSCLCFENVFNKIPNTHQLDKLTVDLICHAATKP